MRQSSASHGCLRCAQGHRLSTPPDLLPPRFVWWEIVALVMLGIALAPLLAAALLWAWSRK